MPSGNNQPEMNINQDIKNREREREYRWITMSTKYPDIREFYLAQKRGGLTHQ